MEREALFRKYHAEECIGCGRCTYACVASQRYEDFSPRRMVESAQNNRDKGRTARLWACTACGACSEICNAGVDLPHLIRALRGRDKKDEVPLAAHHGVLTRAGRLTASPRVRPDTTKWVTPDLELDPDSRTLLFVGCTPYFDVVLRYIRNDLLDIPRSSVRLLNAMGIRPRLLRSERCCGHDAYWAGDDVLFQKLVQENVDAVRSMGVEEIVTFCPECASAWRDLYPQVVGDLGIKVRSMAEVLAEGLSSGRLSLPPGQEKFTFQDPCRSSKGGRVIDQPRAVLRSLGELQDMPRSGAMSACCGTAGWVDCDHTAKKVQMDRLNEAAGTGADTLITACPKCLIHLSCAQRHHGAEMSRGIDIEDLYVRAARDLMG